jgi:lipoyl(octanoyl) transferase
MGRCDYMEILQKMQEFTNNRVADNLDEIWILEHDPVFTLGLAGKREHILFHEHNIPIVHCDRGGQVTYHGPGQVIIYTLIDIKRINLSIRELVEHLEAGVINYLANYNIIANGNREAPGVYVEGKKIASLGLKVKNGCTYHGLSFNVAMDIEPFNYINVCGYSGLKVTQLQDLVTLTSFENVVNEVTISIINSIYGTINK